MKNRDIRFPIRLGDPNASIDTSNCLRDGGEQVGDEVFSWPGGYTVDIRCALCNAFLYREMEEEELRD